MADPLRPRVTMHTGSKMAGIVGSILALAAVFVATYYPEEKALLTILAVAGGATLLFFVLAERRLLARKAGGRGARHGANALVITLAFVGILVILNVLAARHNEKWDATSGKLFTLSEQTVKVLRGLKSDVQVTAFFADASEAREGMKRLLEDYADETAHLRVSFVDPDKNPALANQYGIREYNTSVFESAGQTYRITETTEEAATNALVRVTREGAKTVLFTAGHGEHGLQDTQRSGYSHAKAALEEQGFTVKELLLLREGEVPADCDVLVVAGPTKPFLEQEVEALTAYLARGGRLVLLLDPETSTGLEPLLAAWGVVLRGDIIIDTMSRLFGGSYTTPILSEYPSPEVTKEFNAASFLPLARSVGQAQPLPEGVTFRPVARTTPQSWGETDLSNERASFDPSADLKGPLTVVGLFEKQDGEDGPAQLLVAGDSDFAGNTYFNFSGNGDLFQNLVSYLAQEEDLIAIRPRDARPSPLTLTQSQAAALRLGTVLVAPLALALAGLGVWWRRRNL